MGSKGNINAIAWNPHFNGNTLGVACDGDIRAIDMRSLELVDFYMRKTLDLNPILIEGISWTLLLIQKRLKAIVANMTFWVVLEQEYYACTMNNIALNIVKLINVYRYGCRQSS